MTSFPITTLPLELCVHVSEFLPYEDWQQFLNCSKTVESIRIATRYILLNFSAAEKYCNDEAFYQLINSKVQDRRRQLCLAFHACSSPDLLSKVNGIHRLILSHCNLQSIARVITDVRELILLFCDTLEEVNAQSESLQKVNLYMCPRIQDFSQFSHLTHLKICDSRELRDLKPLKDVKYLTLINCPHVTDLSGLVGGRHHSLSLVNCQGITDVSPLEHYYSVEINACHNIRDFTVLRSVTHVSIEFCKDCDESSVRRSFEVSVNKSFHFIPFSNN